MIDGIYELCSRFRFWIVKLYPNWFNRTDNICLSTRNCWSFIHVRLYLFFDNLYVINKYGVFMWSIPLAECDLNLTPANKGILGTVTFLGIICSSHFWGYLADTIGRRRVIMPALLIGFLLTCACSLVQNFYIFVTLRFLNGFL